MEALLFVRLLTNYRRVPRDNLSYNLLRIRYLAIIKACLTIRRQESKYRHVPSRYLFRSISFRQRFDMLNHKGIPTSPQSILGIYYSTVHQLIEYPDNT